MNKYDRSKVSPGPWSIGRNPAGTLMISDADGNAIDYGENRTENAEHVVASVNNHDDLVKALENCLGWMKSFNAELDEVPYEVSRDMYQSIEILNRAKGE